MTNENHVALEQQAREYATNTSNSKTCQNCLMHQPNGECKSLSITVGGKTQYLKTNPTFSCKKFTWRNQ